MIDLQDTFQTVLMQVHQAKQYTTRLLLKIQLDQIILMAIVDLIALALPHQVLVHQEGTTFNYYFTLFGSLYFK